MFAAEVEAEAENHDENAESSNIIDLESLMDMDIVLFCRRKEEGSTMNSTNNTVVENLVELGAIQEDGTLAPLSAWTDDCAFQESLEFVVDEEDRFPGLSSEDVQIFKVLDESCIAYGSRQVGGGMGPGNPHGEESELCYYVDASVLSNVKVVIKPELEIFW